MQTLSQFAATQITLTAQQYMDYFEIDQTWGNDCSSTFHVFKKYDYVGASEGEEFVIEETPDEKFIVEGETNEDAQVFNEATEALKAFTSKRITEGMAMSRIKTLYEDEQERRHAQLFQIITDQASEYGLHPDDDHDIIEEMAQDHLDEENAKSLGYLQ